MSHVEIPIKVTAWVDEGVAPLVEALNEIHGLTTLDSCQEGPLGEAFVFFAYGENWQELATLMQEMSSMLSDSLVFGYSMNLEWLGSNTMPRAQVLVRPEHAASLADSLLKVVPELNRHMNQLVGDRQRRAPHNLQVCSAHLQTRRSYDGRAIAHHIS